MQAGLPCSLCNLNIFNENNLIAETDFCRPVVSLGQFPVGGYVLLIPKRHVLCVGAMTESEIAQLIAEATRLADCIAREYGLQPLIFEHGIVGHHYGHAYMHFIPVELRLIDRVRSDFLGKAEIDIVPNLDWLRRMYSLRKTPYLFWNDSSFESAICWNPPAPKIYFNRIIAEMLGCPERADWRNVDSEEDKKLYMETVKRLKKYF